jgi:hypothetical protein
VGPELQPEPEAQRPELHPGPRFQELQPEDLLQEVPRRFLREEQERRQLPPSPNAAPAAVDVVVHPHRPRSSTCDKGLFNRR